ncbi:hypothetical protein QOZ88_14305 [Blastococcus sp. BMG 814]|uniref:Uncharacterized protein n=1 Tax=Blastococcus carthaginiensis TaxID=3050034 RepID=A0ABT9IE06_9ACTN|nr:hypothetical protein [Blastococcus carthaginiensis]MDP5183808.1 hypothetical protein [Blastococcus carthaginiensis]
MTSSPRFGGHRVHGAGSAPADRRGPAVHLHRFRWLGPDAFSSATLYRCRCGEVRSGF